MSRLLQIAFVFFFAFAASAQTLRIQMLDGKTGRPVANEHVNLYRGSDSKDLTGNSFIRNFVTDRDGVITTTDIDRDTKTVGVAVSWHRPCLKEFRWQWFSLSEVFSSGLVSENSCKPTVEKVAPPGTLIFFVREETFFEKMAH